MQRNEQAPSLPAVNGPVQQAQAHWLRALLPAWLWAALPERLRAALPEFQRFALTGLASAGIYFGLLAFFAAITRLSLTVRAMLAYGIGIIFNYLMQRSFTFRSTRQHQHAGPRYMVVQLGGWVINSGVIWLGVDVAHFWFYPVQFAAIVLTAVWSYLGQKFWAFDGPGRQG